MRAAHETAAWTPAATARSRARLDRALSANTLEFHAQPRQRALARAVLVRGDGLAQALLNPHRAASPAGRGRGAGAS